MLEEMGSEMETSISTRFIASGHEGTTHNTAAITKGRFQ